MDTHLFYRRAIRTPFPTCLWKQGVLIQLELQGPVEFTIQYHIRTYVVM